MKKQYKILLINIGIAIFFAILLSSSDGRSIEDFTAWYGMIGLGGGLIDLIIGMVSLANKDKSFAQGFLLSAGILMLTGFLSCSILTR